MDQLLNRKTVRATWCGGRATPRRLTLGSRPSISQTARSGSLSTRLPHPAGLRPSGLTSVQVRCPSRRRPLRHHLLLRPRPLNPRPDGMWRPWARRARLRPPLLVPGGRTRAGSSPAGASGAAAGGPRWPRLSLGLADPGRRRVAAPSG